MTGRELLVAGAADKPGGGGVLLWIPLFPVTLFPLEKSTTRSVNIGDTLYMNISSKRRIGRPILVFYSIVLDDQFHIAARWLGRPLGVGPAWILCGAGQKEGGLHPLYKNAFAGLYSLKRNNCILYAHNPEPGWQRCRACKRVGE